MIICIGEILVDLIGKTQNGETVFSRYAGGAPFNVACCIKKMGAAVGFVGRVGNDLFGEYLLDFAKGQRFDYLDIVVDDNYNTTQALVEINTQGERNFSFIRKNSADYRITHEQVDKALESADFIVLGSLMLSTAVGRSTAEYIVSMAKKHHKKLCFDVNFRADNFINQDYKSIYSWYIKNADVLKFSEEELDLFASGNTLEEKLQKLSNYNKLICVTLGEMGSLYSYNGAIGLVESIKVTPVDTTGAGDAFFGCLLSELANYDLDNLPIAKLIEIVKKANICGALATTKYGAID